MGYNNSWFVTYTVTHSLYVLYTEALSILTRAAMCLSEHRTNTLTRLYSRYTKEHNKRLDAFKYEAEKIILLL